MLDLVTIERIEIKELKIAKLDSRKLKGGNKNV